MPLQDFLPRGDFKQLVKQSMQSTAFAETDEYGLVMNIGFTPEQAQDPDYVIYEQTVCLAAGSSVELAAYVYNSAYTSDNVSYYSDNYPAELTITQDTIAVPSPLVSISPTNPDIATTVLAPTPFMQPFTLTAPAFDPGLSSLLIPINIELTSYADGVLPPAPPSSWPYYTTTAITNLIIFHAPTLTLTNLQPANHSVTVPTGGQTSLPASVHFASSTGSSGTLEFQLSKDNFATIAQSATVPGVASGSTAAHTFTNLTEGSYTWRVVAADDGSAVPAECAGAAYVDPAIMMAAANVTSDNATVQLTSEGLASTGDNQTLALKSVAASFLGAVLILARALRNRFLVAKRWR